MARHPRRHFSSPFANAPEPFQPRRHHTRIGRREGISRIVEDEIATCFDGSILTPESAHAAMTRETILELQDTVYDDCTDPVMMSDGSVLCNNNLCHQIPIRGFFEQLEWDSSLANYHSSVHTNTPHLVSSDATPSANGVSNAFLDAVDDHRGPSTSPKHHPDRSWAVSIHLDPMESANSPTCHVSQQLFTLTHEGLNRWILGSSYNEDAATDNIGRRDSSDSSADGISVDRDVYVNKCLSNDRDNPWSPEFRHHTPVSYYHPLGSWYKMSGNGDENAEL